MADPRLDQGPHATHDLELIARAVAGDGTDAEAGRAATLVAACADCRGLDADLRTIVSSVRALGTEGKIVRAPRDFRLTPQDAARLRRRGVLGMADMIWAGFRAGLGSFRGRVGGGFVAIGIIGILLGSGLGSQPARFEAAGAAPTAQNSDVKGPVTGAIGVDPGASDTGGLVDGAAPTAAPASQGPTAAARSGSTPESVLVLVVSGLLVVAGLALLLSAGRGRRAGP